eukprot:192850_1
MNYKTVGILVLAVCLVSSASGAKLNNHRSIGEKKNRISSHLELEDKKEHKECKGGEKCEPLHKLQNKAGVDYVCNGTALYEYLTAQIVAGSFPSGICATKVTPPIIGGTTAIFDIGCACKNQRLKGMVAGSNTPWPGAALVFCLALSESESTWFTNVVSGNPAASFFCSTAN